MERPTCSHAPQTTCPLQAQAQEHAGDGVSPCGAAPRRAPAAPSSALARVSRPFLVMTGLRLSLWLYDHVGDPPSLAYDVVALGFVLIMPFAMGLLFMDIRNARLKARSAAAARQGAGR